MRRRGLTLLELLLVVALLLAVAAIALPDVYTALRERAFESSAELVRAQLLLARAHAQATGRPVEVGYDVDPPCLLARFFDPEAAEGGADEALIIPAAWADRPMPDGVWMADRPVDDGSGSAAAAPLRLAVFMPDGSALLAGAAWICDDHGRLGRLAVNPWTGRPEYQRGAAAAPADGPEEPEEPPEPEPPEPDEPPDPAQLENPPTPGETRPAAEEGPATADGDGYDEPAPPGQEEP